MKENVMKSLTIMWKGLLAIFIVTLVIMLAVYIFNLTDKHTAKKKEAALKAQAEKEAAEISDLPR